MVMLGPPVVDDIWIAAGYSTIVRRVSGVRFSSFNQLIINELDVAQDQYSSVHRSGHKLEMVNVDYWWILVGVIVAPLTSAEFYRALPILDLGCF